MHIFYTPDIGDALYYDLSEEESKHSLKVLRLKTGDLVQMIDGLGNLYKGTIEGITNGICRVSVGQKVTDFNGRNYALHVAIAPTKNADRFEWFLEKATEIGIDEITPLICSRSERRVVKTERCEKIIISAMKQSVIAKKPVLNNLMSFVEFIETTDCFQGEKFIAHCAGEDRIRFADICRPVSDTIILIGPEGDFTMEEITAAMNHSYQAVTLGMNRLRTETAGIVACHTVSLINT